MRTGAVRGSLVTFGCKLGASWARLGARPTDWVQRAPWYRLGADWVQRGYLTPRRFMSAASAESGLA